MDSFRKFLRGPWGKVVLAAIILPFVISGFYGYFTGGPGEQAVAEVEGTSIHRQAVNQRVQQIRQQVRQQSPDVDQDMLEQFITPAQVLQGMVNNALLAAAARDAGMLVSEAQVVREIRQAPQFQQDGQFSEQLFERAIRGRGHTPRTFLSGMRQEMVVGQLRAGYQTTEFVLPGELKETRRLSEQKRDVRVARLALDELLPRFEITDEEVEEYFERNRDEFVHPEKFRMAWLEMTPDVFRDQVEITEEELREEYEVRSRIEAGGGDQVRHAAHLMLSLDRHGEQQARELAESLRQRIAEGEDFEELVAEYSDDAATARQGGDLGRIGRGVLPDPLEDALFGLSEGEISEPVASDDGIHLLRLARIEGEEAEVPSFEEMEAQLREELLEAEARARLNDSVVRLEELAFEHPDLQRPAEVLGLEIRETDWFSLDDPEGPARMPEVREAFASEAVREQDYNSDLLELSEDHYMVVRKLDQREPEPMAFEEVAGEIRERLRRQRAGEELERLAEKAEEARQEGLGLAGIAEEWGVEVAEYSDLGRGDARPHRALVDRAFRLPRPDGNGEQPLEVFRLPGGDLVALTLEAVRDGDTTPLEGQALADARAELGNLVAERTFQQVVRHLRETGRVEIHQDRLERDPREEQRRRAPQQDPQPIL